MNFDQLWYFHGLSRCVAKVLIAWGLNGTFSWVWGSTAAIKKKGFCWKNKKQKTKFEVGKFDRVYIYSTYGKKIWLVLQQVCCYCFCFNHYVPKVKGCLLKPVQSVVQKPAFVILTTSQLCAFIHKKDWDLQDFICLQDISFKPIKI